MLELQCCVGWFPELYLQLLIGRRILLACLLNRPQGAEESNSTEISVKCTVSMHRRSINVVQSAVRDLSPCHFNEKACALRLFSLTRTPTIFAVHGI